MKQVYLYLDGQTVGPFNVPEIAQMVMVGDLSPVTLYFNHSQALRPLFEIPEVKAVLIKRRAEPVAAVLVKVGAFFLALILMGLGFVSMATVAGAVYFVGGSLLMALILFLPRVQR